MRMLFLSLSIAAFMLVTTYQAARQTKTDFDTWATKYVDGLHMAMPERKSLADFEKVKLPVVAGIN